MESILDRKLGGKVRDVLELLRLENRVIDDLFELELFCKVIGNQPLCQFVGNDSIQQVELVDPIERLTDRDRVEQVSEGMRV